MLPIFSALGIIAFIIYIILVLVLKKHNPFLRAMVSVFFGLMFMNYGAYAPMVIYLSSAIINLIPVKFFLHFDKYSPKLRLVFWNVIPSVLAIVAGYLGIKYTSIQDGYLITFLLPTMAILCNLLISIFSYFGKGFSIAPVIRSAIWISYFALAGIYVSILYEVFNLVLYFSSLLMAKKGTQKSATSQQEQGTNGANQSRQEQTSGDTNAFVSFAPSISKGQW